MHRAPSVRPRLPIAAALGVFSVPATYSALRLAERVVLGEPDPSFLLDSPEIPFFRRLVVAAYVAVAIALVALFFGPPVDAERAPRLLLRAVWASAVLAAVQAVGVP